MHDQLWELCDWSADFVWHVVICVIYRLLSKKLVVHETCVKCLPTNCVIMTLCRLVTGGTVSVCRYSCSAVEEKLNMPEGVLKKVIKTKEEKQRELQEVSFHVVVFWALPTVPRWAFTVSRSRQVHVFICKSLTLSSTPQPLIWFSCFSYLSSQNMEFLTASHSAVSNTLFI